MSEVRQIHIKNFRSIKELIWNPKSGLNCLIGPGDSGKSTILDAIDLTLSARHSYPFTDADFYQLDTNSPIEIFITLGTLDDELKNLDTYGFFLRSFDQTSGTVFDEPRHDHETVLTIKLSVNEDLDPNWLLYSERAETEEMERRLPWKHRELISPARLGSTASQHLAWGNRSILNKLSDENLDTSATLATIGRRTREAFAEQGFDEVNDILTKVKDIANGLGVPVGELQALLDVKGVSLSNGAISIHNSDNTPLRQLGTGSARLLISGLQKAATTSKVLIVDEAEYGLEPFRITRLLNELGSKDEQPLKQVFITTHSPYVLRELQANQLHVVRRLIPSPPPAINQYSHHIFSLQGEDEEQATLRACAEAFFSRSVIVGEGKTEVGLMKGMDLYYGDINQVGIHANGGSCTDGGGGDKYLKRAKVFKSLDYKTSILQDSDITDQAHLDKVQACRDSGISVFEWGNGASTEVALFTYCPLNIIPLILQFVVSLEGEQRIDQHIQNCSNNAYNLSSCLSNPTNEMRPYLSQAAGSYKWFKDISKAEELTKTIIGPHLHNFSPPFSTVINNIIDWVV